MKNIRTLLVFTLLPVCLSGCKVPASFGYAFGGTAILMIISLVFAAMITKRGEGKH